jgi:hypothetical protein
MTFDHKYECHIIEKVVSKTIICCAIYASVMRIIQSHRMIHVVCSPKKGPLFRKTETKITEYRTQSNINPSKKIHSRKSYIDSISL